MEISFKNNKIEESGQKNQSNKFYEVEIKSNIESTPFSFCWLIGEVARTH